MIWDGTDKSPADDLKAIMRGYHLDFRPSSFPVFWWSFGGTVSSVEDNNGVSMLNAIILSQGLELLNNRIPCGLLVMQSLDVGRWDIQFLFQIVFDSLCITDCPFQVTNTCRRVFVNSDNKSKKWRRFSEGRSAGLYTRSLHLLLFNDIDRYPLDE